MRAAPIASFALLLALCPALADAQPRRVRIPWRRNVIRVQLASLVGGVLSAEYERAVAPRLSFYAAPSVSLSFGVDALRGGFSPPGVGLGIGLRTFVLGRAPRGLWIGFGAQTGARFGDDATGRSTLVHVGASISAGYSVVLRSGWAFSFGAGAVVSIAAASGESTVHTGDGGSLVDTNALVLVSAGHAF